MDNNNTVSQVTQVAKIKRKAVSRSTIKTNDCVYDLVSLPLGEIRYIMPNFLHRDPPDFLDADPLDFLQGDPPDFLERDPLTG